jgi:hypothetical protein
VTAPDETGWDCSAYGSEGRKFGALCFVSGALGKRVCGSQAACREVMTAARRRVFSRIQEGAAAGDPDMAYLAEEFSGPEQLLGGIGEDGSDE